jgi:hypothetical protein
VKTDSTCCDSFSPTCPSPDYHISLPSLLREGVAAERV